MKLLTFIKDGKQALGVKTEAGVIDIGLASSTIPAANATVPQSVMEVIEGGEEALSALHTYLMQISSQANDKPAYVLNESELTWGPCVTRPNKIICVGLNYRKHADETKLPYPEYPILFNKFNNALTGHGSEVAVPEVTDKLDYEVELGIVIGKNAKNVSVEDALDYVFGYCTANDLSARDLQMRTQQWLLGKTCDDFCPIGPYLVTADQVGNPNDLALKTILNGEVRQNSNTSDMIFKCDEIVSYISQHMTLVPGDIILTGTPEGVIMGYPPEKQNYLKPGDEITVEIEKLGALTNRFIKE
jgi:2-keto-4-pentenoate hydratase/2-oxohepta-3-ene-1,7-dioic acid hydratase in catechol pathway